MSNVILRAAGPAGSGDDGVVQQDILIYVNNTLAAIYILNGGNSITFSVYGNTTTGLELAIESVNTISNMYCLIQKDIQSNNFGVVILSDITNMTGIVPGSNGYIYKMIDETARYPILTFNTSAIKTLEINNMSNFSSSTKLTSIDGTGAA